MNATALWYATRASGIVALVLLTLTMVLGVRAAVDGKAAQAAIDVLRGRFGEAAIMRGRSLR